LFLVDVKYFSSCRSNEAGKERDLDYGCLFNRTPAPPPFRSMDSTLAGFHQVVNLLGSAFANRLSDLRDAVDCPITFACGRRKETSEQTSQKPGSCQKRQKTYAKSGLMSTPLDQENLQMNNEWRPRNSAL
jgi:hypothetical protein